MRIAMIGGVFARPEYGEATAYLEREAHPTPDLTERSYKIGCERIISRKGAKNAKDLL